jgi:hypothetical protein
MIDKQNFFVAKRTALLTPRLKLPGAQKFKPRRTKTRKREQEREGGSELIDTENDGGLLAADFDEGGDGADTAAGQLGEENHALDVVVL